MRQEADKLLRAAEQVRLMEYEVGLKLYERVKKGSKLVAAAKREPLRTARSPSASTTNTGTTSCAATAFSLKSRCIEETAQ